MNLKSILSLLIICTVLQYVNTEAPKCAFKSRDDPNNTLEVYSGPPWKPNGTFADGICSEYQNLACCDPFQVAELRNLHNQMEGLLASCPACLHNVMAIWCSFTCSPFQGYFVNIDSVDQDGHVVNTSLHIHEDYAQSVYDSCSWVSSDGVKITEYLPNYDAFFGYLSSKYLPTTTVKYSRDIDVLNQTATPCTASCNCQSCQQACEISLNTNSTPFVHFWGRDWTTLSVVLAALYLAFVLIGFAVIVYVFYYRFFQQGLLYRQTEGGIQFVNSIYELTGPKITTSGYRYWHAHGRFIARHPYLVITVSMIITGICAGGIKNIEFEEYPYSLWVPPESRSTGDRSYFDDQFGGMWRSEQIIVTSKTGGPVLNATILLELLALQQEINEIQDDGIEHSVLCTNYLGCVITSPLEFWQNNATKIQANDPVQYIQFCLNNLLSPQCLSSTGLNMGYELNTVFGGFNLEARNYTESTALIVTYMLKSSHSLLPITTLWENQFVEILQQERQYINVAFSAESSVKEELSKELFASTRILIIAYVSMFLYVSLSLGDYLPFSFSQLFVKSKFLLGLAGVYVVMSSIVIAYGLCGYSGVKASLVVNQVLPFLVLAIGVDNVFILSNTYQSLGNMAYMSSETRLGETLARVGSSITLTSISSCMAFLLGSLARMPAVQTLSIYSSAAIFFNFALQITCFVAFMVIDSERKRANRVDCLPCIKLKKRRDSTDIAEPLLEKRQPKRRILGKIVEKFYAPLLLHPLSKILVIYAFIGMLFIGINYSSQITVDFVSHTPAVGASRFKLQHTGNFNYKQLLTFETALRTQSDYVKALEEAYKIVDDSGLDVFPFSNFYTYYEQFLYTKQVATIDLCLALGGSLVVSLVLLHNPWISVLVTAMVIMIEINVIGIMQIWGISLNAVSVVNLAIGVGIGLEFCSHIAYSFSESEGSRDERAKTALTEIGTSVFSGITLTKLCGIIVFSFTESVFFQTYYFKMFLAIAVVGALHGLVFFPVLLSLVGTAAGNWFPITCKKKEYRY